MEDLVIYNPKDNIQLMFLADSREYAEEFGFYLEKNYRKVVEAGIHNIVDKDEHIIAYIGATCNRDVIELMRGYVHPDHRQKGICTRMIKHLQSLYPERNLAFNTLTPEAKIMKEKNFPDAQVGCGC